MGTCASGSGNASGSRGWGCRAAAWCHGGATVAPRENGAIGALRAEGGVSIELITGTLLRSSQWIHEVHQLN
jgi:hypothetical protein